MKPKIIEVTLKRNGKTLFIREDEYNASEHILVGVIKPALKPKEPEVDAPTEVKEPEEGFHSEVTGKSYKTAGARKAAETRASNKE